jgi:hypothetical protein
MSVTNCHIINNVHTDLATKNGMAAWLPVWPPASIYVARPLLSFFMVSCCLLLHIFIYDGINNKRRQNSSCGSVLANNEE